MKLFNKFHSFNLSYYILVSITSYGWHFLDENEREQIIEMIISNRVIIDGKVYYKLQAGLVM